MHAQPASPKPIAATPKDRLTFLDWSRGVAALIMLQGHTFHSFLSPENRTGDVYVLSQFVGGMPAPIFLFLTGVTLAFLLDGRERRGVDAIGRWAAGLRRAGYLLLLAFVVRLQAYLFSVPWSRIEDVLRVDILNCMGVSLALLSLTALVTTRERIKFSLLIGTGIALLAPLVSALDWNSAPAILRAYIAPHNEVFGIFPWAAFTAFGVAFGSILRCAQRAHLDRVLQWTAIFGFGLVLAAGYFSSIPYSIYKTSEFWLNSPGLVFIKVGVILLLIVFAYVWVQHLPNRGFSVVTTLGTSSLLVYWLHLEIVYGRWFWFWKNRLSPAETAVFAALLVAAMTATAWLWRERRLAFSRIGSAILRLRTRVLRPVVPEPEG